MQKKFYDLKAISVSVSVYILVTFSVDGSFDGHNITLLIYELIIGKVVIGGLRLLVNFQFDNWKNFSFELELESEDEKT